MAKKIDDFDLDDFDLDQPEKRSLKENLYDILIGAKSKLSDEVYLKQTIRKILPRELKQTARIADGLGKEGKELYNEFSRDMGKYTRDLKIEMDKMYRRNEDKFSSEFAKSKIEQFLKVKKETIQPKEEKETNPNDALLNGINDLFKQNDELSKRQGLEESIRNRVNDAQHKENIDVAVATQQNIFRINEFNDKITLNYQKKNLEIQYKQLFVQTDIFSLLRNSYSLFDLRLQDIQRTSSMSDFEKMSASEKVKENLHERVYGKVGESISNFTGNMFGRVKERIRNKALEKKQQLQEALVAATNILKEMSSQGGDIPPELVKQQLMEELGGVFGPFLAEMVVDKLAPKIQKIFDKKVGNTDKGKDLKYLLDNKEELFNDFVKKRQSVGNKLPGFLQGTIFEDMIQGVYDDAKSSLFGTGYRAKAEDIGKNNIHDLSSPAIWDNMSRKSIVEIIPGWLSKIAFWTERITNPKAVAQTFDVLTNKFVSEKVAVENISKHIYDDNKKESMRERIGEIEKLMKLDDFSEKEKEMIRKKILFEIEDSGTYLERKWQSQIHFNGETTSDNVKMAKHFKNLNKDERNKLASLMKSMQGGDSKEAVQLMNQISYLGGHNNLRNLGILEQKGKYGQDTADTDILYRLLYGDSTEVNEEEKPDIQEKGLNNLRNFRRNQNNSAEASKIINQNINNVSFDETSLDLFKSMESNLTKIVEMLPDMSAIQQQTSSVSDVYLEGIFDLLASISTQGGMGGSGQASPKKSLMRKIGSIVGASVRGVGRGIRWSADKYWDYNKFVIGKMFDTTKTGMKLGFKATANTLAFGGRLAANVARGGRVIVQDIYLPGSYDKPVLELAKLRRGEYFNRDTGETIRAFKDINCDIVDESGNLILTKEQIAEGLHDKNGKRLKPSLFGKIAAGGLSYLANAYKTTWNVAKLGFLPLKMAKGVSVWAYKKLLKVQEADIYVIGETEPRMLLHIMKNGGYVNSHDGSPIFKYEDIKSDVKDLNGNVVLSLNDIRKGIVDQNGKPFKSLTTRILGGVKKAGSLFWKYNKAVWKGLFKLGKGVLKGGFNVTKALLKPISTIQLLKKGMGKNEALLSLTENSNNLLYGIYNILNDRLKKPKGLRKGSWEETFEKRNQKKIDLTNPKEISKSTKKNPLMWLLMTIGGTLMTGFKWVKNKFSNFYGMVKDFFLWKKASEAFGGAGDILDGKGKGKGRGKLGRGLGKVGRGLGRVGGGALRAVGGTVVRGGAMLAGSSLGTAVASGVGTVASTTGAIASGIGSMVSGAGAFLASAGSMAMSGLAAAGSALGAILTAPVTLVVGAVALTAYAAYKLASGQLGLMNKLRMAQYGLDVRHGAWDRTREIASLNLFNDHKEQAKKIMVLEEMLDKTVSYNSKGEAQLGRIENTKEILELFEIDAEKKPERFLEFSKWLHHRFKPTYLLWKTLIKQYYPSLTLLAKVDDDLPDGYKPNIARKSKFEKDNPNYPYDVTNSPFSWSFSNGFSGDIETGESKINAIIKSIEKKFKDEEEALKEENSGKIPEASTTGTEEKDDKKTSKKIVEEGRDKSKLDVTGKEEANKSKKDKKKDKKEAVLNATKNAQKARAKENQDKFELVKPKTITPLMSVRLRAYGLNTTEKPKPDTLFKIEWYLFQTLQMKDGGVNIELDSNQLNDLYAFIASDFGLMSSLPKDRNKIKDYLESRFFPVFQVYVDNLIKYHRNSTSFLTERNTKPNILLETANQIIDAEKDGFFYNTSVWDYEKSPWDGYVLNKDPESCKPFIKILEVIVENGPVSSYKEHTLPIVKPINDIAKNLLEPKKQEEKDTVINKPPESISKPSLKTMYKGEPASFNGPNSGFTNAPFGAVSGAPLSAPPDPNFKVDNKEMLSILVKEAKAAGITDPTELALFLANTHHESGGFTTIEENMNYKPETLVKLWPNRFPSVEFARNVLAQGKVAFTNYLYNRKSLGNREGTNDGWDYRGSGLIQLTGRANFENAARRLGIDIVNNPDLVRRDPTVAAKTAVDYWVNHPSNLRAAAQRGDQTRVRKIINGGHIGLNDVNKLIPNYLQLVKSGQIDKVTESNVVANENPNKPATSTTIPLNQSSDVVDESMSGTSFSIGGAKPESIGSPLTPPPPMEKKIAEAEAAEKTDGEESPVTQEVDPITGNVIVGSKGQKYTQDISPIRTRGNDINGGGPHHVAMLAFGKAIEQHVPGFDVINGLNDEHHQNKAKRSLHTKGLGMDFKLLGQKSQGEQARVIVTDMMTKAGLDPSEYKILDEYNFPSADATGGHMHFQFNNEAAANKFLTNIGKVTSGGFSTEGLNTVSGPSSNNAPASGYDLVAPSGTLPSPQSNVPFNNASMASQNQTYQLSNEKMESDELVSISRESLNVQKQILSTLVNISEQIGGVGVTGEDSSKKSSPGGINTPFPKTQDLVKSVINVGKQFL